MTVQGQERFSYELGLRNYNAFRRSGALDCVGTTKYVLRVSLELERAKVLLGFEFDEENPYGDRWETIVARGATNSIPVEIVITKRGIAANLVILIVYNRSSGKVVSYMTDLPVLLRNAQHDSPGQR